MKDGAPITQSTSIMTVNHTNKSAIFYSTYSVSKIGVSDNGTYTCIVSNPIGGDSHTITVGFCKYLSKYLPIYVTILLVLHKLTYVVVSDFT